MCSLLPNASFISFLVFVLQEQQILTFGLRLRENGNTETSAFKSRKGQILDLSSQLLGSNGLLFPLYPKNSKGNTMQS